MIGLKSYDFRLKLINLIKLWAIYTKNYTDWKILFEDGKLDYLIETIDKYIAGDKSQVNKITENLRKNILN
jgi:hypothetical protein